MEEEGHKIIKLNIGNLAVFGFDPPDEIVQDMIRNLPQRVRLHRLARACSRRARRSCTTRSKSTSRGVTIDDIYLGNGASELIVMSMNALLNDGDEVLVPAPDYPLWTAAVEPVGRHAGALRAATRRRLAARHRRHQAQDHAAHPRDRRHQPEQSDRRAVSGRAAAGDRRDRAPASADRVRRRDLRQDAVRRRTRTPRIASLADDVLFITVQRPVEELPLLRLPRRLDGGLGREAATRRTTSRV